MFSRAKRTAGWATRHGAVSATAFLVLFLVLPGCSRVRGLVQPSQRGTVDAHVVFHQRVGCPALVARTLRNGYTVLVPEEGFAPDLSGIFEGPVREGLSVYRYYVPGQSTEWGDEAVGVEAEALAVSLDLPAARAFLDIACGTRDTDLPSDDIPRRPDDDLDG